jgi:outer membrane receptor protein involved in Fe transport
MSVKVLTRVAGVSVAAIAASMWTPSFAQDASSDGASTGAEDRENAIIVTAQGREQSLQDVPISVSVLSGETLVEQGVTDLQGLSTKVSNVKITTGSLVNSINIRGVGSGENPGFEQAVATFADGVYRSRSRTTMAALFDVERVEVLKGPQTTFFGANASAGALNISTRKPNGTFEYDASALYEFNHGEYDVQGGVSFPVSDSLSARVAGRLAGMDGWIDLPNESEGPQEDTVQGRLSLRWEPSATWTTDFRIDGVRTRIDDFTPFQLAKCPPPAGFPVSGVCQAIIDTNGAVDGDSRFDNTLDFHAEPGDSFSNFDFVEIALNNSWDVGPGTLRSITAYSDMSVSNLGSLVPTLYATPSGNEPFPVEATEDYEFYSQELRFESATGGLIEYLAGAYYHHGRLDYTTHAGFFFNPAPFPSFPTLMETVFGVDIPNFDVATPLTGYVESSQKEETFSAFAALTINPADNLRINLGGRYSNISKEATRRQIIGTSVNADDETFVAFPDTIYNANIDINGDFVPDIVVPMTIGQMFCGLVSCDLGEFAEPKVDNDKFMPSAGVQFDVAPDVMLYANYSMGFKAGGFSTTSTASTFGPEEVDAYEIGMKSKLFNGNLTLNVAAFRMDYQGLQETTFDANLASSIDNAAGARSEGVEVGVSWRLSDYLTFGADVAYLDAVYTDYPNGECTKISRYVPANPANPAGPSVCAANGGVQDMSGKRRSWAPEWSGSVRFDAAVPVGNGELQVTPSLDFSSWFYMTATADDLLRQKGYAKANLRIAYGPSEGPWQVALIGRNLTNEVTTSYRLGVPGGDGSTSNLVDRGRSIGVQFVIRH